MFGPPRQTFYEIEIDLSDRQTVGGGEVLITSTDDQEPYLLTAEEAFDLSTALLLAATLATEKRRKE